MKTSPSLRTLTHIFVLLFTLSGTTHAAVIMNSSISVSQNYNDNIFFTKENTVDDLTTIVSPQLGFAHTGKNINLGLGYRGRALFYAENTDQNNFFHALSIDLDFPILNRQIRGVEVKIIEEMSFSPELPGFSFFEGKDQTAIARNNRLPQGGGQGVRLRKTDTFQNQAGISLSYDWTERLNTVAQYTNVITRFSGSQFKDRNAHLSTFGTSYRYPFSPRTSLTNNYRLAATTGDALNRVIHTVNVELAHQISPTFSATAGVGSAYIKGNQSLQPIFSAGLNKLFQNGEVSVVYKRRVSSGLGVVRGVTRRQRVLGNLSYNLTERTGIYLRGSYASNKSIAENEINIINYGATTGVSTQFLYWLSGGLSYSYIRQETKGALNTLGRDGKRNLILFELTIAGPPWRIIK
ncbi:MAG: hypothetical protein GXO96_02485 [Nitrospirae bacterium]|nr:hypothetical protein [Candidatus Manganitrophaceae bacterium]